MASKKRVICKVNEELLEVDDCHVSQVTDDDLLDIQVLGEGLTSALDNDVNKIVNEAYTELTSEFKQSIKQTVLQAIGFENRWGKWEVDHCNSRSSMLTDFVGKQLKQFVHDELDKMTRSDIQELLKPVKKAIKDDFVKEFRYVASQQVRSIAADAAKKFITDMVTAHLEKVRDQMSEQVTNTLFGGKTNTPKD